LAQRLLLRVHMYQLILVSCGALFLSSAGAFLLFVPLLSIATVVVLLVGLMLMFWLGFHSGIRAMVRIPHAGRRNPHVHLVNLPVVPELNRKIR
jgi:hypothetical protein